MEVRRKALAQDRTGKRKGCSKGKVVVVDMGTLAQIQTVVEVEDMGTSVALGETLDDFWSYEDYLEPSGDYCLADSSSSHYLLHLCGPGCCWYPGCKSLH